VGRKKKGTLITGERTYRKILGKATDEIRNYCNSPKTPEQGGMGVSKTISEFCLSKRKFLGEGPCRKRASKNN